jgi:hypothetical protein
MEHSVSRTRGFSPRTRRRWDIADDVMRASGGQHATHVGGLRRLRHGRSTTTANHVGQPGLCSACRVLRGPGHTTSGPSAEELGIEPHHSTPRSSEGTCCAGGQQTGIRGRGKHHPVPPRNGN